MKRTNEKNNVENKVRSILHGVEYFPCYTGSQEKVLHHRGAKFVNQLGITLIALIITIILMLILAGVVLSLTIGENGLFGTAKYAVKKWNNSVEQEQKDLDELYSSIKVAGDSQITLTMEKLNEYIDNRIAEKTFSLEKLGETTSTEFVAITEEDVINQYRYLYFVKIYTTDSVVMGSYIMDTEVFKNTFTDSSNPFIIRFDHSGGSLHNYFYYLNGRVYSKTSGAKAVVYGIK